MNATMKECPGCGQLLSVETALHAPQMEVKCDCGLLVRLMWSVVDGKVAHLGFQLVNPAESENPGNPRVHIFKPRAPEKKTPPETPEPPARET